MPISYRVRGKYQYQIRCLRVRALRDCPLAPQLVQELANASEDLEAAAAARTETEVVAAEEASVARLSLARLSLRDAVLQAEAVAPLTATARIAPDLEERE